MNTQTRTTAYLRKIVSGAQTGVDRAALDVGRELGIEIGGWCPKGRKAEDGPIDSCYPLEETPTSDYRERTEWNIRDSDGTLILSYGEPTGGTKLTISIAKKLGKPCFLQDLLNADPDVARCRNWIQDNRISILNVAGPRESRDAGKIGKLAEKALRMLLLRPSAEETVAAYHERTKHHYHRFAASSGYMDWATQPDPFRRYEGASLVQLPLPENGRALPYWQLYATDSVEPVALSIDSISLFFRYALSLTAWKGVQRNMWSLRANPSSGNLHPTEGYALLPGLGALHDGPGVYHYAPREHGLERRADIEPSVWVALMAPFPEGSFLLGLSSIHWREAWKYGERAFRYCQQDAGHALGTVRFAAAALGWKLCLLDQVNTGAISALLGLNRDADYAGAEREHPELLALVVPEGLARFRGLRLPEEVISEVVASRWYGSANALSPEHKVDWPVIDLVARATSGETKSIEEDFSEFPSEGELFGAPVRSGTFTAEKVILGRRSAVSMDATTAISADTFFRMLARLVPTRDKRAMPWDAISWRPRIHLGIFVHRVNELAPGLYMLVRDPEKTDTLRQTMRREFLWLHPAGCPPRLPLYLLKEGDYRALATKVSCDQGIAGDSAFSLGMIADYMNSLKTFGAAFYRNLFWEAGLIGQVLYLEAEEAGIRSTGMGCYFDDPVHEVFGISSRDWQSFYHFTVGGPVEDGRLTTMPAYGKEER